MGILGDVLGGLAVVGGVVAAPFTGGASLLVSAGGVGIIVGSNLPDGSSSGSSSNSSATNGNPYVNGDPYVNPYGGNPYGGNPYGNPYGGNPYGNPYGNGSQQGGAELLPNYIIPTSPSGGNSGAWADAQQQEAAMAEDYQKALNDLKNKQSPVSDLQAAAQAAQTAFQEIDQDLESNLAILSQSSNYTTQARAIAQVQSDLLALNTLVQDQETLSNQYAMQASQLALQYAGVAPNSGGSSSSSGGSSGSSGGSSGSSGGSYGGTYSTSNGSPSGSGSYGSYGGSTGSNGSIPVSSTGSSGTSTGLTPAQQAAMQNPYASMYGGMSPYTTGAMSPYTTGSVSPASMGSDSGMSGISSMLPELMMGGMMPAMMIPAMTSGMGARQPAAAAADPNAQFASNTTPAGAGPKPQDVSASNTGGADGGDHKEPGADAGTQPASSVQSAGNSVPAGANTDVKLPDGTTTHAPNVQAANAARAALSGANPADAYQQAGVTLPPPGTPILNPVAPGDLQPGDIGMWKDHQVMALGDNKVLVNGQVQPDSSIASSPDFLGWMRPTQASSAPPAVPAPTAATSPAPTPAPAATGMPPT
jgi:hypothetical protein